MLKDKIFKNKSKIQEIRKGDIELTKIRYMPGFNGNSYIYMAQKRQEGKRQGVVLFGLPEDIGVFRGEYGVNPIIELVSGDVRDENGPIYVGSIEEGKDNLMYLDESATTLVGIDANNYRRRLEIAERFNSKGFETSKTRNNIKNMPRMEYQYKNGKLSYTINDMVTGLVIQLENVRNLESIKRGDNLLYTAKLSYKHMNDNSVTESRKVAFELYTGIEFIQTKSEEELLGTFFSQKEVELDDNPNHITYLGNLHKSGEVTRTKVVEGGIKKLNEKRDKSRVVPYDKIKKVKAVEMKRESGLPSNPESTGR